MKFPSSFIISFLFAASTNVANASFPQTQSLTKNNEEGQALASARGLKKAKSATSSQEVGELENTIALLLDTNAILNEKENTIASLLDTNAILNEMIADLQAPVFVPSEIAKGTLEGFYIYLGCGEEYYLAVIECSVEDDTCLYTEQSIGQLVVAERDGEDATVGASPIGDPEDGIYLMPEVIGDDPCVFYGSFKLSEALVGNEIQAFSLEYTASCTVPEDYEYVLGGYTNLVRVGPSKLQEAVSLKFSRDNGVTYYNQDSMYFSVKLTLDEVAFLDSGERRSLAVYDDGRSLVVYDDAPNGVVEYVVHHRRLFICGGFCVIGIPALATVAVPFIRSALGGGVAAAAAAGVPNSVIPLVQIPSLIVPAIIVATALIICTIINAETGPECMDHDDKNCPYWAATGECKKNPTWMHINCKRSCERCQ